MVHSGQPRITARLQGMPGIYLLLLCDVIKRLGHDEQALLEGLDVTRADLLVPDSRISMLTAQRAVLRATAMASGQGLGLAYARALNVTLHGSLGMMALASPTLGVALEAAVRYIGLRAPFLTISFQQEGEFGLVRLEIGQVPREVRVFIMEAMLMGLAYMGEQLMGAPVTGSRVQMPGEPPAYYAGFSKQLPVPIIYHSAQYQLCLPRKTLGERPRLADPEVERLAREQCERELQQLFRQGDDLPARVRELLLMSEESLPTLEQMAAYLHMSSRTLKRHLREQQWSYRDLLNEELSRRACLWLDEGESSISEVAYRLGYNDVSNFSRAFRRWTGQTPREWLDSRKQVTSRKK